MTELGVFEGVAIEKQALILLLMIPIVASITGIARHVIGLKSLGIYAPVILTFSLYALGLNGLYGEYSDIWVGVRNGVIFTIVTILVSAATTMILARSRMHYFPKVSIVLSVVSISLVLLIILADVMGLRGFTSTNAIALVMIATVAEQFTSIMLKKKAKTAVLLTIETMIISIFCYMLIAWPTFQKIMLNYPYLILLTLLINYVVGKFRGLRITEYVRFKQILQEESEIID